MKENNEFMMNYRQLTAIMRKYKRIVLYSLYGEGKRTIMKELKKKYPNFNFYCYKTTTVSIEEPFIWGTSRLSVPEDLKPDVVYSLQYSKEYKEEITGIKLDIWQPFIEYKKLKMWKDMSNIDLKAKRFKNIKQLKDVIKENTDFYEI